MTELNREMINAMRYDSSKVGELLARMTTDEVNHQDSFGYTHLHFACGRNKQVRTFLSFPGIQVNASTMDGWTPVMWAARWGSIQALEAMLEDPRVDLEARTNSGHGLEEVVGYMARGKVTPSRRSQVVRMIEEVRRARRGSLVRMLEEGRGNDEEGYVNSLMRIMSQMLVTQVQIINEDQEHERIYNESARLMHEEHDESDEDEEHADPEAVNSGRNLPSFSNFPALPEEQTNHHVEEQDEAYDLLEKREEVNTDDYEEISSDDFNIESARAELKCPVCLDLMKPPTKIWMCSKSHLVCDTCKNILTCRTSRVTLEQCSACPRCPTCRTSPANLRAFFAENIARALFTGPIKLVPALPKKDVEYEFLVWAKLWHNHDNPRNCGFSPDQERYDIRKEIEEQTKAFGTLKFIEFPYEDFPYVLLEFGMAFQPDMTEKGGLNLVKNQELQTINLDDHHALSIRWHTAWNATDNVWPSGGPGAR